MDRTPTKKELTHARIVEVASRAVRRGGYASVGVADVMKEAGLTHGGFYAHFPSRDALLVEAIEHAGRLSAASIRRRSEKLASSDTTPFRLLVESYLSDAHLVATDQGCPVAALCSEIPRQSEPVKKASAARVDSFVAYVRRSLDPGVEPAKAAVIAGTLIGTLQLARASDAHDAQSILSAARETLLEQYDRRSS